MAAYLLASLVLKGLRIPIYPAVLAVIAGVAAAVLAYFALREYRVDIADWWWRTVGSG